MVQSHLGICLHLGLTEPQLRQVFSLLETNVGRAEAEDGRSVLTRMLADKR